MNWEVLSFIGKTALVVVCGFALEWFLVWLFTPGNEIEGY